MPTKYIIHTAGPVWQGGDHGEEILLRAYYETSLKLAKEHGIESAAFSLISCGIFGYPKNKALLVAISAIGAFLMENDMPVFLVIFDRESYSLSSVYAVIIDKKS